MDFWLTLILALLAVIVGIPGAILSCIYPRERWEHKKTRASERKPNRATCGQVRRLSRAEITRPGGA
jgi:hypothetical protein